MSNSLPGDGVKVLAEIYRADTDHVVESWCRQGGGAVQMEECRKCTLLSRAPFAKAEHASRKCILCLKPCSNVLCSHPCPLAVKEGGDREGSPFERVNSASSASLGDADNTDEGESPRPGGEAPLNALQEKGEGLPGLIRPVVKFVARPTIKPWGCAWGGVEDSCSQQCGSECSEW